ncbi:hypothetical protein LCGC14_2204290, partial [marine sediment metagenome]
LNFSKGKQGYYDNIKFLYYEDVWNLLKFEQVYKDLPAQTSQQILKLLGKNWKSYFGLMREYRKNFKKLKGKRKFLPKPKIPKYKKKNGESITIFTNQQCKIRDGYLIFPKKKCNINSIKTRIVGKINQVSIIPKGIVYTVEIIYEKEIEDLKLNKKHHRSVWTHLIILPMFLMIWDVRLSLMFGLAVSIHGMLDLSLKKKGGYYCLHFIKWRFNYKNTTLIYNYLCVIFIC